MQVKLTKGGPGSYLLRLNQSEVQAEAHTLQDGGLLVQVSFAFAYYCAYLKFMLCCANHMEFLVLSV